MESWLEIGKGGMESSTAAKVSGLRSEYRKQSNVVYQSGREKVIDDSVIEDYINWLLLCLVDSSAMGYDYIW